MEKPSLGFIGGRCEGLDRGSSTVWDVAGAVEAVGLALGFFGIASITHGRASLAAAGLVLLIVGLTIRWAAILTLGRFFVGTVTIQPGHQLVRRGPYQWVRHPAYTGTVIAHFGLGLAFKSWLSVAFSTLPFVFAALYRIRVEEEALRRRFGVAFQDYERDSWRLIPGVY